MKSKLAIYVEKMIRMQMEEVYRFEDELYKYIQAVRSSDPQEKRRSELAAPIGRSSPEGRKGAACRKQPLLNQKKKNSILKDDSLEQSPGR